MKSRRPLILVTNDDGINAPGIRHLIEVMKSFGDIVIVAPDKPQSGVGHGITLEHPLRLEMIKSGKSYMEYSCSGTPVDCVKLALNKVVPRKPDLCVSGINHGPNSSINVIYSGTMSAAIEASIEDIPSFGISLCDTAMNADLSTAGKFAKTIALNVLKHGLQKGTCLNVNIPAVSSSQIKGVKVCRQAVANWQEKYDQRTDPNKKTYFWLSGDFVNYDKGKDTDVWALANHYVSVVPVQFDVTAHYAIPYLVEKFESI